MSCHQKILEENSHRALNLIWSLLRTFIESKPQSNRLHSKVLIFRYERKCEFNGIHLSDVSLLDYILVGLHVKCIFIILQYCINLPVLSIIPKPDYRSMLEDKNLVEAITKNVTPLYPVGIELSLSEKYKHLYYNVDNLFDT